MRVLSMQSPEVWEILQRDSVYHADITKCREGWNYKEDMERLGGYVPIWCFYYPEFSFITMYNNELLEELRCELSLDQKGCWDNFVMFELEIDESRLSKGMQHNGSSKCKVFAELFMSDVKAVYKVRDADKDSWYFKVITPMYLTGDDVIATKELDCSYWCSVEDTYTGCFFTGDTGYCLNCGKPTNYLYAWKHYRCLAHLWKHKSEIIHSALIKGENVTEALLKYNTSSDEDYRKD